MNTINKTILQIDDILSDIIDELNNLKKQISTTNNNISELEQKVLNLLYKLGNQINNEGLKHYVQTEERNDIY